MKINLTLFALTMVACGSSKDEDAPDCAGEAALVAAAETCDAPEADYQASCEDDYADAKALGCGEEFAAMTACAIVAEYEYDCSGDGEPAIVLTEDDPCEAEFSALFDCALSGAFGG